MKIDPAAPIYIRILASFIATFWFIVIPGFLSCWFFYEMSSNRYLAATAGTAVMLLAAGIHNIIITRWIKS